VVKSFRRRTTGGWLRELRGCLRILERLVERSCEGDVGVVRWMEVMCGGGILFTHVRVGISQA